MSVRATFDPMAVSPKDIKSALIGVGIAETEIELVPHRSVKAEAKPTGAAAIKAALGSKPEAVRS